MTTVLIRDPVTSAELKLLQSEFPQFRYRIAERDEVLRGEDWDQIEILYGHALSLPELEMAHSLRWIHSPVATPKELCVKEIEQTTNVVISMSKETCPHQIGEFALGAILAFAKNLFHWKDQTSSNADQSREEIWGLKGRTLLQIGLGSIGSSITKACSGFGMRILGLHNPPSYHPHCQKVYPSRLLHSLLPSADIVSIGLRRGRIDPPLFGMAQLGLMKEGAILVAVGSEGLIDFDALLEVIDKFRGVAIDTALPKTVNHPKVLLTPEIAELPLSREHLGFNLFLHNLRRFVQGDFAGMKNLLSSALLFEEFEELSSR